MKRLLILGAGIGGLSVLKELRAIAELPDCADAFGDLDITMVDEDFSHFLGFTLPWVMRGWRDRDTVPIRPSALALSGVTTVTGSVQGIDAVNSSVTLADSTRIDFDALIIATGARNTVDDVPGLVEAMNRGTAVHYYSADAAADAHQALRAFTGGNLVFLVASDTYRCPVAPYEGALLAADLLRDNGVRDATRITVYSPEIQPMPSAGPHAGLELVDFLSDTGIGFFGEHRVAHVDADAIQFEGGTRADYNLLVFIPPHRPALAFDGPGWINVDPTTMQTRHPGIFAVGDATVITAPSGRNLPKAAVFARNGGTAAARNALRHLGVLDDADRLSGEGFCYIDTGSHTSSQGKGDFFASPHPEIHLSAPSAELHHDKHQEEQDWRACWEQADVGA